MKIAILRNKTFTIILLTGLSIVSFELSAQVEKINVDNINKRLDELESFQSYTVDKVDSADLIILNDSTTTFRTMTYYYMKEENGSFGKVTVNFLTGSKEVTRTFYMDKALDLVVIVDTIVQKGGATEKLTYYLDTDGRFVTVINQRGEDITNTISNKQLDTSIKVMFTKLLRQQYSK